MSKTKLLLVEDSKIILVELKKFLAATGLFDILVAENGIKALEELKKNSSPLL